MLTFRGVPVIARFDTDDRHLRVYWASVHGLVRRFEDGLGSEADLITAIRELEQFRITVTVERTAEAIEVSAVRK